MSSDVEDASRRDCDAPITVNQLPNGADAHCHSHSHSRDHEEHAQPLLVPTRIQRDEVQRSTSASCDTSRKTIEQGVQSQSCTNDTSKPENQQRYKPDRGYAWLVLFGSFVCNFLVDGVVFAFGGIYEHLKVHFHSSAKDASLVGSLLLGFYLLMGPVTSVLCKLFGCRVITMAGALFACLSFIISMFATDILYVQLSLGVLGGIGFGLIYLPSIVIVGYWFDKKRALATGMAVCGSSLGGFALVPLCNVLLQEYDWWGTTLILGGFVLNAAWAGALFRSIEDTKGADKNTTRTQENKTVTTNGNDKQSESKIITSAIEEKARKLTESTHSLDNCVIMGDHQILKLQPNEKHVEKGKLMVAIDHMTVSDGQLHKIAEDVLRKQRSDSGKKAIATRQSSTAIEADSNVVADGIDPASRTYSHSVSHSARLDSDASKAMKDDNEFRHHRSTADAVNDDHHRRRDLSKSFTGSIAALPIGSVNSLQKRPTIASTHKSQSIREDAKPHQEANAMQKIVSMLHETFDISLLKSPTMIMIIASSILSMLGFFLPFMFINGTAQSIGLSSQEAQQVLMLLNIANAIGRVIAGWMSDKSCVDVLWTNNLALILAGAATMCVPLCTTYALLCTYAAFFGICIAAFVTLRSILLVEVLGLEKLTNAFGWLILFQGFAVIFGPPVGGAFFDATQSYSTTFLFGGGVIAFSGVALIPLRKISQCEKAGSAASSSESIA